MNDYFALFGFAPSFDLDETQLDVRYRVAAAQVHPDQFAAKSSFEQKQAVMMAATLNEAYRVLRHPTDRAAYLLQQAGVVVDAPEHTAFAPEFLMQQMQWREELAEAQSVADLAVLQKTVVAAQQDLYAQLGAALADGDALAQAAQMVRQARFLDKLLQEIVQRL